MQQTMENCFQMVLIVKVWSGGSKVSVDGIIKMAAATAISSRSRGKRNVSIELRRDK